MSSGMQFTDKASAALADAQDLAQQYAHSQLLPIHLGVALLDPSPDESKDQQNDHSHKSHASSSASLFKQCCFCWPFGIYLLTLGVLMVK